MTSSKFRIVQKGEKAFLVLTMRRLRFAIFVIISLIEFYVIPNVHNLLNVVMHMWYVDVEFKCKCTSICSWQIHNCAREGGCKITSVPLMVNFILFYKKRTCFRVRYCMCQDEIVALASLEGLFQREEID